MKKTPAKKLTLKAEKFVRARLAGKSQAAAYKEAGYPRGPITEGSAAVCGCQLEKRPDIKKRLQELSALANEGAILDAKQIQAELSLMAIDSSRPDGVRLKAIDQLSKTKGLYTDNIKIEAAAQLSIEDKKNYMQSLLGGSDPE